MAVGGRSRNTTGGRCALIASLALLAGIGTSLAAGEGPAGSGAPNVRMVDGAALRSAIAAQKGKVVVLNLWATWCPPCVEEFPALVKLYETYRKRGLVVIAASLDEPGDRDRVASFLKAQKASFPVYLRKSGDPEEFIEPTEKGWTGAVPTTFIYRRNGNPAGEPIVGGRSYEQFAAVVEPLLK